MPWRASPSVECRRCKPQFWRAAQKRTLGRIAPASAYAIVSGYAQLDNPRLSARGLIVTYVTTPQRRANSLHRQATLLQLYVQALWRAASTLSGVKGTER